MLLIDKLNMIYLELLIIIDKQLYKAQNVIISSTTLFDNLFLVIFISDFY